MNMTTKALTKEQLDKQPDEFRELAISQVDRRVIAILDQIPLYILKLYVETKELDAIKNRRKKL
jgi:hypothetical protein